MEVRLYPNIMRPGAGQKPRRESQRPLLPQHARHCPVLEAGSALGFLVFPPLERIESFHVGYQGDGRYQLTYFLTAPGGQAEAIFALLMQLPMGGIGMVKEQITFMSKEHPIPADTAMLLARAFLVPEDLGTPAGGISLRGATNFQTPPGWDTVYTSVLNTIERPYAPMLVVRVETDWFPHESEFRYVLQPGEGINCAHNLPIGQVFFVPREDVTLRDCTDEEAAAISRARGEFFHEKAAVKHTTGYGLQYSPLYSRRSRSQKP
uniref:Uncharacterized protein n=1 Tax=uncultured bacterium BAC10-10 TaxID=333372 RepID=Q4JIP1_9BACT|nr:hypothetical protein [uncultured bacterium BAC10-10]